jgi:protein involved in ribonucleotide reduction
VYELQLRQKAGETIDVVELRALQEENKESIVNKLVKKGEYQILVEDVDIANMDVNNLVEALGMKLVNKLPKAFKTPLKQMYLNDDTRIFQFMSKTFQYSDFVAKYALYKKKYILEGVDEKEVIKAMDDIFVDFSFPTHKVYRHLDKSGIFMFNKYYKRIFRGIVRSGYKKFASTVAMKSVQWSTAYDVSDILDTPETLVGRIGFHPFDQLIDSAIPDTFRILDEGVDAL